MDIRKRLGKEIILFDGAMGTMLQNKGLKLGENPEVLNFINPEVIADIYQEYIKNGARVITTNTFGANELKLKNTGYSVEEVYKQSIKIAKEARNDQEIYIAADIGPIGELLAPMGTLSFDNAYEIFKRQVIAAEEAGADLLLIETMTDLYEVKAAILAAKENTSLPVFCTMSFEADGRTFTGCTPSTMALTIEGLGADALGVNCSLGPKEILKVIMEMKKWTNLPLMVQPNAGLPNMILGKAVYDISEKEFTKGINKLVAEGVSIVGGCCGTTPKYIGEINKLIKDREIVKREKSKKCAICSATKTIEIDRVRIIGERINPTGKKLFKEALRNGDMDYILRQGIEQIEAGAEILDVNVGLPEIDESSWMKSAVVELQGIIDAPLQIDATNKEVIENGLRYYNGKPILNSINGENEVLDSILPLVKKYGAAVIGLTLDKEGIPETAEGRLKIAEKIMNKAISYGIKKEDIFIDTLVLPISANGESAKETLKALELVKNKLGLKTLLGVSNISFGLPNRELINKNFLAQALVKGLDLPIINPNIEGMIETIDTFKLLNNMDRNGQNYIEKYGAIKKVTTGVNIREVTLQQAIENGLKSDVEKITKKLLKEKSAMEIVNEEIVPSLNKVGDKFEKGLLFLPQLISSAETVQRAFKIIKEEIILESKGAEINKGKVILATVEGDIHDIGKNIVKVMLESYGFQVIDLGKDVAAEKIIEAIKEHKVTLVGLSALMTTTVINMEKTIKLIKSQGQEVKTIVGGAVLTNEYARKIGADFYAKDAMETVKIAEKYYS